jgi:GNAT superfamily N-acetyltransferase
MRLELMTQADFDGWVEHAIAHYAVARQSADASTPEESMALARKQFGELLPDGLATVDHELLTLWDGDEQVGTLWLNTRHHADGDHVFGYDFEIREDLRRRGYGRAAMVAAETHCRDRGAVALELNVFGTNLSARALYEEMGFEPTAIQMRKLL